MEVVVCRCKQCRSVIGKFVNLWMQVNKLGLSPIIKSDDNLKILGKGRIGDGTVGTLGENW